MQKVPARKNIRAMLYNLDKPLSDPVNRICTERLLDDFKAAADCPRLDILIDATRAAIRNEDKEEAINGVMLLKHSLPPITYGEITAGTHFYFADALASVVMIKRKGGVEIADNGKLWPHARCCEPVLPIEH